MKKILILLFIFSISLFMAQNANAVCIQCPEIQKLIKKEIKLDKSQKKEIKEIKKNMKSQIKDYTKEISANERKIDKILKVDCPDIVSMMEIKNKNAKIQKDIRTLKKESYAQLYEVYTNEQQKIVKRILSENSNLVTKCKCEFCDNMKPRCAKCK